MVLPIEMQMSTFFLNSQDPSLSNVTSSTESGTLASISSNNLREWTLSIKHNKQQQNPVKEKSKDYNIHA